MLAWVHSWIWGRTRYAVSKCVAGPSTPLTTATTNQVVPVLSADQRTVVGLNITLAPDTSLAVRLQGCDDAVSNNEGYLELTVDNHALLTGKPNAPTSMHMALDGLRVNYTYHMENATRAPTDGEKMTIQSDAVNVDIVHLGTCSLDVLTYVQGEPSSLWAGWAGTVTDVEAPVSKERPLDIA